MCVVGVARAPRAWRSFFFVIVDFPLEGAHATTREGVYCCVWCVVYCDAGCGMWVIRH